MATFAPIKGSRPYHGSCHCGFTKYIVWLTFPHPTTNTVGGKEQFFSKCNCTTCHKLGLVHVSVPSAPNNFILLSPLDPFTELGDYQCGERIFHWFFCRTCGGRCFSSGSGEGEHIDVDLDVLGVKDAEKGTKTKVWRKKESEGATPFSHYLTVNGVSIDAGQEGFDMREWVDKGWMKYEDFLTFSGSGMPPISDKPFIGGTY